MMKTIALLLGVTMFAQPVMGQKKGKIDPKDVTIDSLTAVNAGLKSRLDSTTMTLDKTTSELKKYQGLYDTIRDKVVMHDFDPATMGSIIDSLVTARDAKMALLTTDIEGCRKELKAAQDSIAVLQTDNLRLEEAMDAAIEGTTSHDKIVAELKQLKELLDNKIITQQEYDAKKLKLLEKW